MPDVSQMSDEAIRQARAALLQQSAMSSLPKYLALGAGVGAGAQGLLGLYNMLRRNLQTPPRSAYSPVLTEVPYPQEAVEEEQRAKRANTDPVPQGPLPSVPSAPTAPLPSQSPRPPRKEAMHKQALLDYLDTGVQKAIDTAKQMWNGEYATDLKGVPWFPAAATAAAGAGGYGGWRAMQYLLKRQRKKERLGELNQARQEYEQALLEQQVAKRSDIGQDLDRLYEGWQKVASEMEKQGLFSMEDMGKALGMYLLAAGGVGAFAGKKTYDFFRKRNPSELLRKAQLRHRRALAANRPSPIYARPVPLDPKSPIKAVPVARSEDEDILDTEL